MKLLCKCLAGFCFLRLSSSARATINCCCFGDLVNWLKKFLPGLKVVDSIDKPLKLYCDTNNLAVHYAQIIGQVVLPNTLT